MSMNEDEAGKMFVGGLSWDTDKDALHCYFSRFGEITDCVVMKNPATGRSRGFGFITFKDQDCVSVVLSAGPHKLDDRSIDPKACTPRGLQQKKRNDVAPKLFLGGLPQNATETDIRSAYSKFGKVSNVAIMYDQENKRSKGFGFLSFDSEESVDRACAEQFMTVKGKKIECKRAESRDNFRKTRPQQPRSAGPTREYANNGSNYQSWRSPSVGGGYGPPSSAGGYGPPSTAGGYGPPSAAGGYGPSSAAGGYGSQSTSGGYGQPSAAGYGPPSTPASYGPPPSAAAAPGNNGNNMLANYPSNWAAVQPQAPYYSQNFYNTGYQNSNQAPSNYGSYVDNSSGQYGQPNYSSYGTPSNNYGYGQAASAYPSPAMPSSLGTQGQAMDPKSMQSAPTSQAANSYGYGSAYGPSGEARQSAKSGQNQGMQGYHPYRR